MRNYPTQYEVVRIDGFWRVREIYGDDSRLLTSRRLKRDAINYAQGAATITAQSVHYTSHPLEVVIKKRNGRIQQKDSYGTDPSSIPG